MSLCSSRSHARAARAISAIAAAEQAAQERRWGLLDTIATAGAERNPAWHGQANVSRSMEMISFGVK